MENDEIMTLMEKLDGSDSDEEAKAIDLLRKMGNEFPRFLLNKYRASKKWQARCSCVYNAIRYARDVEDAVQLGIEALSDRSKIVRYRACMLLGYALNESAIPFLEDLSHSSNDSETIDDANAAIDAIKHKNSNFFVDRDHTGDITLRVN